MSEEQFDIRQSTLMREVAELGAPQSLYSEKAGKVRWERVDGALHLYRREDIVRVNRHPSVLGTGGRGGAVADGQLLIPLEIDGEDHAKWRRLLDPIFAPKQMRLLEDSLRELARDLIAGFAATDEAATEAELYERFCVPLPCLAFLRLIGAPVEDLDFFLEFKDGILHPQGDTPQEMEANVAEAGEKLYTYFGTYLAGRRAEATERHDVIGTLLTSEVDGAPVGDDDLLNIIFLLMFAGLDTVTASLSCLIAWLADHPEERHRVIADPSLVPGAVEELLRHESPVPTGMRYATEDLDLGDGLVIEAGETIHAVWAAANLDPTAFEDPLRVDLDRPRHTHIAFASGTHRCLGSHLARLELRIALEELHKVFADYTAAPDKERVYDNVVVRGAVQLPLVLTPRAS